MTIEKAWDNIDSATQRLKAEQIEITVLNKKAGEHFRAASVELLKKGDNRSLAEFCEKIKVSAALVASFAKMLKSTNHQIAQAREAIKLERDYPTGAEIWGVIGSAAQLLRDSLVEASELHSHLIELIGHITESYQSQG